MSKALDKIMEAEQILNVWLCDHTEEAFEEQPDIDQARSLLHEALDLLDKAE